MDLLTRVTRATLRRPGIALFLGLVALFPAGWLASHLEFESSFTALLPESYQAVKDLKAGIERTGGSAFAVVAVGAQDRAVAERYADALHQKLIALPITRYVESKLDITFIEDRQLLYLSEERLESLVEEVQEEIDARTIKGAGLDLGLDDPPANEKAEPPPSIDLGAKFIEEAKKNNLPTDPYMVGKDGKYLYVFLALKGDTGNMGWARQAQATLEETAKALRDQGGFPKDLELRFSGSLVIRLEEDAFLQADLKTASAIGFCAVVLLLVVYTRRPRTLLLLSFPLLVGITFTFAFAELAIGRLNIISGFLASILSGLGIEFAIHLYLRHLEERGRGKGVDEAAEASMATTGRSLVGSALTNAGAFFVVSFAGFQGFSEFGVIAGVGMLLTLSVTLLLFPALNVALERIRPMKVPPIVDGEGDGLFVPRWLQAAVLAGMTGFFVFSVYQLSQGKVHFRTNWREIKGESPASDFDDYIIESLGGSFTQSLVLVEKRGDLAAVEEVVKAIEAKRKAAGKPVGITGTLSLDDLIPARQEAKLEWIQKLDAELARIKPERLDEAGQKTLARARQLTQVRPFDLPEVPDSLKQRFLTAQGEGSLVILRTNYLFYEHTQVVDWADEMDELRAELQQRGLETPIISENWLAGTVFKIIIGDGPFILLATLIVVFLVILLDFRSLGKAALVLSALMIGQISIAGAMALFGIELNFINAAILPIIVGVSIDNAVHIYHRFLEGGPDSIPKVLRYTASATSLSSATNLMGFGAMIVAHHKGLRSVAELAILGITLTFLSTSVFFPIALGVLGRRIPWLSKH